eukprot:419899-Ditylum_brightwellii.AAC.1
MKHAEDHGYLADEQHGDRKGRTSIDIVLLSHVTTEIQHYQQSNAAMTDCNAKPCFNCITPELLALLYANVGCPPAIVELMHSALVQLEYSMITALGVSSDKSINSLTHLIFGIGQGATIRPPGW